MPRDFKALDGRSEASDVLERGFPQLCDDLLAGAGGSGIRVERRETVRREPDVVPTSTGPAPAPAKPRNPRRLILIAVLLAAAVSGGWYGYHWWTVGRFIVWTDDAYVSAKTATLAAKVSGYIATLNVEDNASV